MGDAESKCSYALDAWQLWLDIRGQIGQESVSIFEPNPIRLGWFYIARKKHRRTAGANQLQKCHKGGVKLWRDVTSHYFNRCDNSWCLLSKDILTPERYLIVSKDIDSYLLFIWHYLSINCWFVCNLLGDSSSVTLRQNRKILDLSKDTIGLSLDTDSYLLTVLTYRKIYGLIFWQWVVSFDSIDLSKDSESYRKIVSRTER